MLLGHIALSAGIVVDPGKVKVIWLALAPNNQNALLWFLGQVFWHGKMLWYLADLALPL